MIPWEETDPALQSWRFALLGEDAPDAVPAIWIEAFSAVGADLHHRRQGRRITLDHLTWELWPSLEHWVHIGIHAAKGADIGSCRIGQGFTFDTTLAQATVWVAETAQDDLTGYEFVQWPSDGWRILTPQLRDEVAVWVDPSTNEVVSRIGSLSD